MFLHLNFVIGIYGKEIDGEKMWSLKGLLGLFGKLGIFYKGDFGVFSRKNG